MTMIGLVLMVIKSRCIRLEVLKMKFDYDIEIFDADGDLVQSLSVNRQSKYQIDALFKALCVSMVGNWSHIVLKQVTRVRGVFQSVTINSCVSCAPIYDRLLEP